jgi:hypothetical protein
VQVHSRLQADGVQPAALTPGGAGASSGQVSPRRLRADRAPRRSKAPGAPARIIAPPRPAPPRPASPSAWEGLWEPKNPLATDPGFWVQGPHRRR